MLLSSSVLSKTKCRYGSDEKQSYTYVCDEKQSYTYGCGYDREEEKETTPFQADQTT
jgi:hypothetical protein